jgi:hypothetical protein
MLQLATPANRRHLGILGTPERRIPTMADDADKPDEVPFLSTTPFPVPPARPFPRAVFEAGQGPFETSQGMPLTLRDQLESQARRVEDHVALGTQPIAVGEVEIGQPTLTVNPNPITTIGKAVLGNKAALQLAAFSLRASLDARLEQIRVDRLNSEDPTQYEDLRRRVDEFLVASISGAEAPIVATTLSLADGLRNWWNEDHSSICNKLLNIGLFAGGLTICGLAGALGPVSVPIVATLIGGKDVASALESCVKLLAKRD